MYDIEYKEEDIALMYKKGSCTYDITLLSASGHSHEFIHLTQGKKSDTDSAVVKLFTDAKPCSALLKVFFLDSQMATNIQF